RDTVAAQQTNVRPDDENPAKLATEPAAPASPVQRETKPANAEAFIIHQQAVRDFAVADFYRRTGHLGSAHFYYELIKRRYPHTDYAREAGQRLDELKGQPIRPPDASEEPRAPEIRKD